MFNITILKVVQGSQTTYSKSGWADINLRLLNIYMTMANPR